MKKRTGRVVVAAAVIAAAVGVIVYRIRRQGEIH
jgi:hypothetical protein